MSCDAALLLLTIFEYTEPLKVLILYPLQLQLLHS